MVRARRHAQPEPEHNVQGAPGAGMLLERCTPYGGHGLTRTSKAEHVVFILWGGFARKKKALIDENRHTVVESAHPSPLSAHNGFFGSRPFSKTNTALEAHGQAPVSWQL